jgi:hypothetical protein
MGQTASQAIEPLPQDNQEPLAPPLSHHGTTFQILLYDGVQQFEQ